MRKEIPSKQLVRVRKYPALSSQKVLIAVALQRQKWPCMFRDEAVMQRELARLDLRSWKKAPSGRSRPLLMLASTESWARSILYRVNGKVIASHVLLEVKSEPPKKRKAFSHPPSPALVPVFTFSRSCSRLHPCIYHDVARKPSCNLRSILLPCSATNTGTVESPCSPLQRRSPTPRQRIRLNSPPKSSASRGECNMHNKAHFVREYVNTCYEYTTSSNYV